MPVVAQALEDDPSPHKVQRLKFENTALLRMKGVGLLVTAGTNLRHTHNPAS